MKQRHYVRILRNHGTSCGASRALHKRVFRYVWSIYGNAACGGEEAGDDCCPPHFSTNLSGEWGETDCMGNVRLHNDRFSLIKRLEANSKKPSEPCAHRPFWQFVLKPFLYSYKWSGACYGGLCESK